MFKKVFKNSVFLSGSQVISRLIGFAYFIFMARFLGVEKFGTYSFILSFVYNFIPVADFGIERLVLIDLAREPEKSREYISKLLPLRFFLALATYLIILILGLILGVGARQIFYLSVFGLAIIPYNITFLITSYLNSKEKMIYISIANIFLILLTALFGLVFAWLKLDLAWILTAYPLANLLLMVIFLASLRREISAWFNIDWGFWKNILSKCWTFAALTILAVFYLRMSVILVNLILGPVATGLYSSAFKFIEAGILIPQSLALALFPVSSKLFVQDKVRLGKVYLKGLLVLFVLGSLATAVFNLFSKNIINLSYGRDYFSAFPVLSLVSFSLVLFFMNALAANVILNSDKVKTYLFFNFSNLLILIFSCLILIPKYNLQGAAVSVLIAESFGLIVNNLFVYKILKK